MIDRVAENAEVSDARTSVDPWNSCTVAGAFEAPLPEVSMLVPDLDIGPGRPIGIWSAPGGGKNITVQSIALSVATGRPVFGRFECKRGRVLHITYDMGGFATTLRFRQLANGMGIELTELEGQLELAVFPSVALTTEGAEEAFAEKLTGFDLVVLDNARNATPGIDENSSQFGGYISLLGAVAERARATVIYLHHTRKGDGAVTLNDGRGTSAILAASGTIWALEGEGDAPRKLANLRPHDTGLGLVKPLWLMIHPGDEGVFDTGPHQRSLRLEALDKDPAERMRRAAFAAAEQRTVLEIIRANPGIGKADLRNKSGSKGSAIDAAVEALLNTGAIEDRGEGGKGRPRAYFIAVTADVPSEGEK